jgi:hypothetical protein
MKFQTYALPAIETVCGSGAGLGRRWRMGVGHLLTRADNALHLLEHLFDIGQPQRLLARTLEILEHMQLVGCDPVALDQVFLGEVGLHVLEEGAGDGGREVEGRLTMISRSLSGSIPAE